MHCAILCDSVRYGVPHAIAQIKKYKKKFCKFKNYSDINLRHKKTHLMAPSFFC